MKKPGKQTVRKQPDRHRHSRKDFIRSAGMIAAGAFLLPKSLMRTERQFNDVGIQLYSVRKEMMEDAVGTLKRLAKIGYKELESARSEKGNYYGLAPKEIKKISEDLGMKLRSGHIHVDADWKKSLDQAAETGQQYIISAVLPSKGQTVSHYQESADAFNKLGEECKKVNLSFGYHNHDSEFETENGQTLYDVLLSRCDPSLVKMELDLGWVTAAGRDPLHYFNQYPGRFELWHLKDMSRTERRSVEFGQGKVDVLGLLQYAAKSNMKYFFVEQEEYAVNAFESMEYDYKYLKAHEA
ncbi:MAG TPA: sugar phosphate isomerase/epimerase [Chitinophagaceae bacterium]|nr:sugar phosphate isomerase/epimerase [Chitinophagaceae bacterium]